MWNSKTKEIGKINRIKGTGGGNFWVYRVDPRKMIGFIRPYGWNKIKVSHIVSERAAKGLQYIQIYFMFLCMHHQYNHQAITET